MGRLGYQSDAQAALAVSYNSLESYAASLHEALTRPYPPYEKIGIRDRDGEYNQLATSLLQIENEFYGTIRPKRVIKPRRAAAARAARARRRVRRGAPDGPRPVRAGRHRRADHALPRRLPAALPARATARPTRPPSCAPSRATSCSPRSAAASPASLLERSGEQVALVDWGTEVLADCEPIAAALDAAHGGAAYRDALQLGSGGDWRDPETVPSARVLHAMARNHGNSYVRFILAESLPHRGTLKGIPLRAQDEERFARLAQKSLDEQKKIEAARPRRLRDLPPAVPESGAAQGRSPGEVIRGQSPNYFPPTEAMPGRSGDHTTSPSIA